MRILFNKLYRSVFPQRSPNEVKKKYGIPDKLDWSIYVSSDGWFVAECKDIPCLYTQAESKTELLNMVNDAVLTYYGVPKRESDFIFDEFILANNEVIKYNAELQTAGV